MKTIHAVRNLHKSYVLPVVPLVFSVVMAATAAPPSAADPAPQWSRTGVRHLIGLPGVKHNTVGKLWVASNGIAFESGGSTARLESSRIVSVSLGDERILKGGTLARWIRAGIPAAGGLGIALSGASQAFSGIPFAFGFAASAISQGSADLVTVEFLDAQGGYHAAVFTLPRHAADGVERVAPPTNPPADPACPPAGGPPALSVAPVASEVDELPAEYRALLYERLFDRLQRSQPQRQFTRSAACNAWKLTITVESFHKGDAVKRALLGPVGMLVAATRLTYRVTVTDGQGASQFDEQGSAAARGDRESLDVTAAIAKSVGRKLKSLP